MLAVLQTSFSKALNIIWESCTSNKNYIINRISPVKLTVKHDEIMAPVETSIHSYMIQEIEIRPK